MYVKGGDWTDCTSAIIDSSKIESTLLSAVTLDKSELTDVVCTKLEAAALQAYKTKFLRVEFSDCRLTGSEFAEGQFEDCTFSNVKFDQAGFRFASLKRVRFENCNLRAIDFSNAKFSQVTFVGCDVGEANFVSASCSNVDISGQELTGIKGILGLKGSTISEEQLMQLAPLLASELGFNVNERS